MPRHATAELQDQTVAWRRRKDFRRSELLNAARALIEEEGAASVTMAKIAKTAGVSEATVYNYFANKQDLLNQVLRAWAQPFIDRLVAELAPLTELRSRLVLIAIRYFRSIEETPRLHRVFYQEIRWSDYRGSAMHALNIKFAKSIIDTIDAGVGGGELDPSVDSALFRDMLFGGLEHIALRTLFAGRPLDVEQEAARYVDLMLDGARSREGATSMPGELKRLSRLVDRLEAGIG